MTPLQQAYDDWQASKSAMQKAYDDWQDSETAEGSWFSLPSSVANIACAKSLEQAYTEMLRNQPTNSR